MKNELSKINSTHTRTNNHRYKLFFGLGNPGFIYRNTPHNAGFMVIDEIAKEHKMQLNKKRYQSQYAVRLLNNITKIVYVKPRLYTNLSGICVEQFIKSSKNIKIEDIVIVYDDIDLPMGKIKIVEKGICKSHKGLSNVVETLKTDKIKQIRIGVKCEDISYKDDYVLSKVKKENMESFKKGINLAKEAIVFMEEHSFEKTIKRFNDNA